MKYANNPFNIRFTGQSWKGLSGSRNGFCEFNYLEFGIRAVLVLMRSYRLKGCDTPRKIINRFAPPSENKTDSYLSFVCHHSNLDENVVLHSDWQYYSLLSCMAFFESATLLHRADFFAIAGKYHINIVPNKI